MESLQNAVNTRARGHTIMKPCSEIPPEWTIIGSLRGDVRMGTMSYFFKHVLPPVRREFDIDRIYGHCIKNKELLKRGRSKRYTWKGVQTNSMGMSSDGYKSIFLSIYTAITQAAQETSSSGSIQPRFVPVTNEQSNTFIHLEDPHDNYPEGMERKHLYNTAFSLHFKRSKRDTFDVSLGLINCSNLKLTSCL